MLYLYFKNTLVSNLMNHSISITISFLISLLLTTSCVTINSSLNSKQEQLKMTDQTQITPEISQREFLNRMLKMMDFAQSIHDFTPENLEKFFGIKVQKEIDERNGQVSYDFVSRLNQNWAQGFRRYSTVSKVHDQFIQEENFYLSFRTFSDADKNADLLEICDMDMEEFAQKAESLGFVKSPNLVHTIRHHGVIFPHYHGVILSKETLRVTVIPEYRIINHETNERRPCIKSISVL